MTRTWPFYNLLENLDLFCTGKKFLVFNLVSRDLKIKYRRSLLGFFWTVIHPFSLCSIYYVLFRRILKVEIPDYVPFILSGVIPWTFFSTSVIEGTETLCGNAGLLTKVPIPTQVFPFVACITNFITFLLALPILFGFSISWGIKLQSSILYLPILCLNLFILAHAISLMLSIFYVYLRDVKHALTLVMQIWFYATPILYRLEMVPDPYRFLINFNPLGLLFLNFHNVFLGAAINIIDVLTSLIWAILLLTCAGIVQQRLAKRVVELL